MNKQRSLDLVIKITDPRISRIAKIFVQNRPKFLDLYASLYGNWQLQPYIIELTQIQETKLIM